jgi:hypothetical protein
MGFKVSFLVTKKTTGELMTGKQVYKRVSTLLIGLSMLITLTSTRFVFSYLASHGSFPFSSNLAIELQKNKSKLRLKNPQKIKFNLLRFPA